MRIATPAFFCFPFAWNIFLHPLTFSLYLSLGLKWVSCRQHIYGSCFCIRSASLCLLVGAFNPFRGMGWGGRWEWGLGCTHVNAWLIHVSVWQKPLQYCKVISLQQIKINEKKNKQKNPFIFKIIIDICSYCHFLNCLGLIL